MLKGLRGPGLREKHAIICRRGDGGFDICWTAVVSDLCLQNDFNATVRSRLGDYSLFMSVPPRLDQLHEALFHKRHKTAKDHGPPYL